MQIRPQALHAWTIEIFLGVSSLIVITIYTILLWSRNGPSCPTIIYLCIGNYVPLRTLEYIPLMDPVASVKMVPRGI